MPKRQTEQKVKRVLTVVGASFAHSLVKNNIFRKFTRSKQTHSDINNFTRGERSERRVFIVLVRMVTGTGVGR